MPQTLLISYLFRITTMATSAPLAGPARDHFIRLQQVGKRFQSGGQVRQVLSDFTLDVAHHEFLAILGESGCGKSTLLRLLTGLDQIDEGAILVDGAAPRIGNDEVGIVFQDPRLFPWLTVEQNVALGLARFRLEADERRRRVREYIALVGLTGFERALPHQLSGGMAQRVALARAIVSRPGFLLLDEPFSALDALTRAQMHEQLLRVREQAQLTVLLVTHDVEEAVALADRVVVMAPRPGRIHALLEPDLPHPRRRTDAHFQSRVDQLRGLLAQGTGLH
jgi:ABC-type nitrate/sulfonate/bicarbonate transport system ATPase subunit